MQGSHESSHGHKDLPYPPFLHRRLGRPDHHGYDEAVLLRLWREKRGEGEPEDLSGNLIVQLGLGTEELNRRWYETIPVTSSTSRGRSSTRHFGGWRQRSTAGSRRPGQFLEPNSCCLVALGRSRRREVYGPAAAQEWVVASRAAARTLLSKLTITAHASLHS